LRPTPTSAASTTAALSQFWRFGNGWLRRVDRTLELAQAIERQQQSTRPDIVTTTPSQQQEKAPHVHTTRTDRHRHRFTGLSRQQVVGAVHDHLGGSSSPFLSTVLPTMGPLLGLNITADLVHQVGDQVVQVAQSIGGLVGTVLTVYGRMRATTLLERRQITLNM
jgi:lysozyme family protein